MKKLFSFLFAFIIAVSAVPISAHAQTANNIYITQEQMSDNASKYIEEALNLARLNAKPGYQFTITLPSGTYDLNSSLHIYSNTRLVLQSDTVLIKKFSSGNMIKLGRQDEVNSSYYGYENVSIEGGVWDGNFKGSCIMRFAHCNNISLKNCVLQNQKNAHFLELAAADNFTLRYCTFRNYSKTESTDGLALQIDNIHSSAHFNSYELYDDTPCKNITVYHCAFNNVYAGVGTRSGVVGSYFSNIRIIDNSFSDLRDIAICAFNYKNSAISGNKIYSATIGIVFERFPESNLTGRMYMPNDSAASTFVNHNASTTLSNNYINVLNSTSRYNSCGIAVYGGVITPSYAKKTGLKAAGYFAQNLSVSGNNIRVNSPSSNGMIFDYMNYCTVNANKVVSNVTSKSNGIDVYKSNSNSFKYNTVKGFVNGVYSASESKKNGFTANSIKNNSQYAINVDKSSKALIYYGNKIKGNKKGKYRINSKDYPLYSKVPKLKVKKVKKKNVLTWNKVKGVTGYRIYRSKKRNSGYTLIKTVKGSSKVKYNDKKSKGKKYYYKIEVYKSVNGSKIYGKVSAAVKRSK